MRYFQHGLSTLIVIVSVLIFIGISGVVYYFNKGSIPFLSAKNNAPVATSVSSPTPVPSVSSSEPSTTLLSAPDPTLAPLPSKLLSPNIVKFTQNIATIQSLSIRFPSNNLSGLYCIMGSDLASNSQVALCSTQFLNAVPGGFCNVADNDGIGQVGEIGVYATKQSEGDSGAGEFIKQLSSGKYLYFRGPQATCYDDKLVTDQQSQTVQSLRLSLHSANSI